MGGWINGFWTDGQVARWIHMCLEGMRGELLAETCREDGDVWMCRCQDGVAGDQAGVGCLPGGGRRLGGWADV